MANYKTGAQRYNDRMDKVFREAMAARKDPINKSHRRHNQKVSEASAKSKALESRSKKAGFYVHGHKNYGDVYEK